MALIEPDFNRVIKAVQCEEPDRVPFAEAAVDYQIVSQFLGKEVREDDLALQVEFWVQAGYDYVPLTIGMMEPGGVTARSKISMVIREVAAPPEARGDESAWNFEQKSFVRSEADFEGFPSEEAASLDLVSSMRFSIFRLTA